MFFKKIYSSFSLVFILSFALMMLVSQIPVQAHAQKEGASPNPNTASSVVREVSVMFNEKVTADPKKFQVYNSKGSLVKGKFSSLAGGKGISLKFNKSLPKGAYYARYSVISADSHVISESWSFIVKSSFKGKFAVKASSKTNKIIDISGRTNSKGVFTVTSDSDSLVFRSKDRMLTIEASKTADNTFTVILPFKGSWEIVATKNVTKFTEEKYNASFVLR